MDRKTKMNFKNIFKLLPLRIAYAHCDIPCGIYDPHQAQLAAHTIVRMTQLLGEIKKEDQVKMQHDISRITQVKEKHAQIVEEELETLRNDYFKEEHFKQYSNLNKLFITTLSALSKARQTIDINIAKSVLTGTLEISEIFFKTKGFTPKRQTSYYPDGGEIVVYT